MCILRHSYKEKSVSEKNKFQKFKEFESDEGSAENT